MTYSLDFRRKILAIKTSERLSFSEVARRFKIGRDTVFVWTQRVYTPKGTKNKQEGAGKGFA